MDSLIFSNPKIRNSLFILKENAWSLKDLSDTQILVLVGWSCFRGFIFSVSTPHPSQAFESWKKCGGVSMEATPLCLSWVELTKHCCNRLHSNRSIRQSPGHSKIFMILLLPGTMLTTAWKRASNCSSKQTDLFFAQKYQLS